MCFALNPGFLLQMNSVYNELLMKQKQAEIMAQQGKRKYEYDSDEDTEVCTMYINSGISRIFIQCFFFDRAELGSTKPEK